MNYKEIEEWILTNIAKAGNFSLGTFLKGEKIFEEYYGLLDEDYELNNLNGFFRKMGKIFSKNKNVKCIYWFKINLIDNAVTDLAGLGKISDLEKV